MSSCKNCKNNKLIGFMCGCDGIYSTSCFEENSNIENAIEVLESTLISEHEPGECDECDAVRAAISALQAQQERNKGCEYCRTCDSCKNSGFKKCYEDCNEDARVLYAPKHKFCPMCGKELEASND